MADTPGEGAHLDYDHPLPTPRDPLPKLTQTAINIAFVAMLVNAVLTGDSKPRRLLPPSQKPNAESADCTPCRPEPRAAESEKPTSGRPEKHTIEKFNLDDFNRFKIVLEDIPLRLKMQEGTVKIVAQSNIDSRHYRQSQGSGVVVGTDAILTAAHIFRVTDSNGRVTKNFALQNIEGYSANKENPGPHKVWSKKGPKFEIIFHPTDDVALILFDRDIVDASKVLPLADVVPSPTDPVIFCGNSVEGGPFRTEVGPFRDARLKENKASTLADAYQGESGGPAANEKGQVWGITRSVFGSDPKKRNSVLVTNNMVNELRFQAKKVNPLRKIRKFMPPTRHKKTNPKPREEKARSPFQGFSNPFQKLPPPRKMPGRFQ